MDYNYFFRNCTYIYKFGKELYHHKKSSYCNEIEKKQVAYDIGFFEMEINNDLKNEENEIAQIIIDTFELHICYDFSVNFEK